MTRTEAIKAMDRQARVRIGRVRNPENPDYAEGTIISIHHKGWVEVQLWGYSHLALTSTVHLVKETRLHPVADCAT